MTAKPDREYGIRHLKPGNLSQLKKELTKQLTALRPGTTVNASALRAFGNLKQPAAISSSGLGK